MPVLKVKKNGVWENISGSGSGGSMNGGNADTLDGFHAYDFAYLEEHERLVGVVNNHMSYAEDTYASKEELNNYATKEELNDYATDSSVSTQIDDALSNFSSGKTLTEHLSEEMMVLTSLQYGDTLPEPSTPGRIFFKRVIE